MNGAPWRAVAVGVVALLIGGLLLIALLAETSVPWRLAMQVTVVTIAVLGGLIAVHAQRQARRRAVRIAALEARLIRAELIASSALLHPHFLLNTLNAIVALVREDAAGAERMLCALGDLLRRTLRQESAGAVPLIDELELAREYLALMRLRWRERLDVSVTADPDALDALVPPLVLQPLIENALHHGIATRQTGRIDIVASRRNGALRVEVCDDGRGIPGGIDLKEGIGLASTRARLAELYGDAHLLEVRNRTRGGVAAAVEVPYWPAEPRRVSNADSNAHRGRRAAGA